MCVCVCVCVCVRVFFCVFAGGGREKTRKVRIRNKWGGENELNERN